MKRPLAVYPVGCLSVGCGTMLAFASLFVLAMGVLMRTPNEGYLVGGPSASPSGGILQKFVTAVFATVIPFFASVLMVVAGVGLFRLKEWARRTLLALVGLALAYVLVGGPLSLYRLSAFTAGSGTGAQRFEDPYMIRYLVGAGFCILMAALLLAAVFVALMLPGVRAACASKAGGGVQPGRSGGGAPAHPGPGEGRP